MLKPRLELALENMALRQQVAVLKLKRPHLRVQISDHMISKLHHSCSPFTRFRTYASSHSAGGIIVSPLRLEFQYKRDFRTDVVTHPVRAREHPDGHRKLGIHHIAEEVVNRFKA